MKKNLIMISPTGANPELYAYEKAVGEKALQVDYYDTLTGDFALAQVGILGKDFEFIAIKGYKNFPQEYETWNPKEEDELVDWEEYASWVEGYAATVL